MNPVSEETLLEAAALVAVEGAPIDCMFIAPPTGISAQRVVCWLRRLRYGGKKGRAARRHLRATSWRGWVK